jgi:arylformamidase
VLEIIDISLTVWNGMIAWPGLLPPRLTPRERMSDGDAVNVTDIAMCAHTGTHMDAPFHHLPAGAGVAESPLAGLVGKALVADLTAVEGGIGAVDLERLRAHLPLDMLLLKTRNSGRARDAFAEDYVYLEPDGAEWIRGGRIAGVGIDALGIERFGRADGAAHKILLGAGIAVLEGLDLSAAEPGLYWCACLPLKLAGADGAPARAVLIRDTEGGFLRAWEAAGKTFR